MQSERYCRPRIAVNNRSPSKSLSWTLAYALKAVLAVVLVPVYHFFNANRLRLQRHRRGINYAMPFAQLIIGPPGSGKSTYCDGMQQFLSAIGRKCSVVNLDPANDRTSYPCALDIRDLVTLEEIMAEEELGPNGGVLYALEELEHNGDWLEEGLKGLGEDYVLFDCPGQVEIYTHHSSLRNLFFRIQKIGYRVRFSLSAFLR